MIKVAIVDDNRKDADILVQYLKKFGEQNEHCEIKVDYFDNGLQFIVDYKAVYDIIFMDIEMPMMDGIETSYRLRKIDKRVALLFVTNMAQLAVRGYEVDAMDFIVKPFKPDRILATAEKILS